MLFNPLFIQSAGQTDTTSSIKQSKLNSPSYLFSDIIKIIHENTIGESSVTTNADELNSAGGTTSSASDAADSSIGQLLTLSENNSGTENINISLNDLLKNLLISSNSDQVNDTKQTAVSSTKNSTSNTLTSSLSKEEIEKLLQSLAAALSQLNISADSIQQVISGNSGSDTANQVLSNLTSSSNGSNQSGSTVAELLIDLSKNSQSVVTSTDVTTSQSDLLKSLYTTIESLLSNSNSNVSTVSTDKSTSDSSNSDSKNDTVSPEVQQLAAALLNLYQNNNGLTITLNSGNDSIEIEIPGVAANTSQTNNTESGDVPGTKGQVDTAGKQSDSINTQQVSANTSGNTKQTSTDNNAAIAAAAVNKAKESFFNTKTDSSKSTDTKTQTNVNNHVVSSKQTSATNSVNKSDIAEAAGLGVNDKVNIKVISKITNTDSNNSDAVDLTKSQAVNDGSKDIKIAGNDSTQTATNIKTTDNTNVSMSDTKINANNSDDNTSTPIKTEITTNSNESSSSITGSTLNAGDSKAKADVNAEIKLSDDNKVKLSDIKETVNTDANTSQATAIKNSAKKISDITAKLKNDINKASDEAEQIANSTDTDVNTTGLSVSGSLKNDSKQNSALDNQKTNQINQANGINLKQDNTSASSTDNINSVNQTNNEDIAQAVNSKQGSSFSDQQQKKSSDSSKNSEVRSSEQISTDFSTRIADTVKDKILNQAPATDSPVKTIKITEITKEITDIIQQNNAKSVVLQIKPESLGKIKVTVDINNNVVSARVEVDTEAIKQIVQNNTTELRQALGLSGMQLSSLSVNLSGGEQKQYQSFSQKKKSGYQTSDKRIEDNVSLASTKSMGYNTYEYLI
jgi:trimeric autotransporter adhesin